MSHNFMSVMLRPDLKYNQDIPYRKRCPQPMSANAHFIFYRCDNTVLTKVYAKAVQLQSIQNKHVTQRKPVKIESKRFYRSFTSHWD